MKKTAFVATLLMGVLSGYSQKYDRESFILNKTHLPEKLIYDQVKTYGTSINLMSSGVNVDYNYVNSLVGGFKSFDRADYNAADLQIKCNVGPYSFVEEKTGSRTVTEEVNKQKVSVTYYKRVHSFRYPVSYTVSNRKNGITFFNNEYSSGNVRTIEGGEYKSEADASKTFEGEKARRLSTDINEHIKAFMNGANDRIKDMYDFYPTQSYMTIFQFKKWDKDDEYNEHIKNIKKTIPVMTSDESPAMYVSRIQADIDYMKSFEGVFKPQDKKEDILYFGNYYNLAVVYFCLDDFEKAKYYIAKLDSVDKKEDWVANLKSLVDRQERRMNKHFLTTTHLNYNPVTDYRLNGKNFISDALSSSEAMMQSVAQGQAVANDRIKTSEGKEDKGKVILEKETGLLKFIPAANPAQAFTLTPINTVWFTKDSAEYVMAKSEDALAAKRFYKVYFTSDRIKLLQLVDGNLAETLGYIGILRPKEDYITFLNGFAIKKKLEKYFADCPTVSGKASDGEYGGSMSKDKIGKYIEMCKEYSGNCVTGTN